MTDERSGDRQIGVEFGDLRHRLEAHDYPASGAELIDGYGEETVELADGETDLEELLSVYEDHEFESAHEVETAVLNAVGSDAVGRENYSDRGGSTSPGADEPTDRDQETL